MYKMKSNYSGQNIESSKEFSKREFKTHHSSATITTIWTLDKASNLLCLKQTINTYLCSFCSSSNCKRDSMVRQRPGGDHAEG